MTRTAILAALAVILPTACNADGTSADWPTGFVSTVGSGVPETSMPLTPTPHSTSVVSNTVITIRPCRVSVDQPLSNGTAPLVTISGNCRINVEPGQ